MVSISVWVRGGRGIERTRSTGMIKYKMNDKWV